MSAALLAQDPHKVREERENILEVAIGREVRAFRHQSGMTIADLSHRTGLSIGMLSKIENGNTSPSLSTLQTLAHAMSVPLTSFFRRFEDVHHAVHTKAIEKWRSQLTNAQQRAVEDEVGTTLAELEYR